MRRSVRVAGFAALLMTGAPALSACSVFGSDDGGVLAITPGECFMAPAKVKAQIADLDEVGCDAKHDLESYAVTPWKSDPNVDESTFPGDDSLTNFADGSCATAFGTYVGVSYLDSSLFYTYLVPSPRSWADGDRDVTCFVMDSGRPMTGSVKGTKK